MKWVRYYRTICQRSVGYDYKCFKLYSFLEEKEWVDSKIDYKACYFLRSYKAALALCDRNNLKYLLTIGENSIETISNILL